MPARFCKLYGGHKSICVLCHLLSYTDVKNNPCARYSHMKTTRERFRAITIYVRFICFDFNAL